MRPTLDVVIIGLNSAKTLAACIGSVHRSTYPQDRITVIYADGGSSDGSQELARSLGARVVDFVADAPAPGGQRNVGWRAGTGELVQFLDSDTQMDPAWLEAAAGAMVEGVGAVNGDRRELHPEASLFNWLGDREWNGPAGEAGAFGGDVLLRRSALEQTGGYDPKLVGGEDPELSYRVRKAGWKLWKLDRLMTWHDLEMKTLKQYRRRAFRTGHAYAEVNHRHPDFWSREVKRIVVRGGGFVAGWLGLVLVVLSPGALVLPLLGTLLLVQPRLTAVNGFRSSLNLSDREARTYAWHASLVALPQFFGVLRYWGGRLTGRPLTNRKLKKRKVS